MLWCRRDSLPLFLFSLCLEDLLAIFKPTTAPWRRWKDVVKVKIGPFEDTANHDTCSWARCLHGKEIPSVKHHDKQRVSTISGFLIDVPHFFFSKLFCHDQDKEDVSMGHARVVSTDPHIRRTAVGLMFQDGACFGPF
ncbi:hypothetical protein IWZ03DRAFT_36139 [Phyllosticta citriasiana]|uniref:Secreted protein n=1 Tax=Phyllosticta citriasiana TaxID=595635 RepID=A0ABR1L5F5_9PEZI